MSNTITIKDNRMENFKKENKPYSRRTFIEKTAGVVAAAALPYSLFGVEDGKKTDDNRKESVGQAAETLRTHTPLRAADGLTNECKILQSAADKCTPAEYYYYLMSESTPARRREMESKQPILACINEAIKKVVEEISSKRDDKNPDDRVRMWLLYNMGYIVKTRYAVFGIDLVLPECELLAPLLDFLLITHYHGDHYSPKLVKLMGEKPVVSNFLNNKYTKQSGIGEYEFNAAQIRTTIGDHSRRRKIPVTSFEIRCGEKTIYHVGDSCAWEQLTPKTRPNVFIPHLSVGLDIKKCVSETIRPETTLVSHILELGHPINKYRWPIKLGLKRCAELAPAKALLPLWGNSYEIV